MSCQLSVKRKRSAKTTREQYEIYVSYFETCKEFRTGLLTPASDPNLLEKLWEDLSGKLNSCGAGPVKTIDAWKRVFVEWKCAIRRKARDIKASIMCTRGGEGVQTKLSDIEERFLDVTARCVIDGIQGLPEAGLPAVNARNLPGTSSAASISGVNVDGFDMAQVETRPGENMLAEGEHTVSTDGTVNRNISIENGEPSTKKIRARLSTKRLTRNNRREINNLVSVAEAYFSSTAASNLVLSTLAEAISKNAEANLALAKAKREKTK